MFVPVHGSETLKFPFRSGSSLGSSSPGSFSRDPSSNDWRVGKSAITLVTVRAFFKKRGEGKGKGSLIDKGGAVVAVCELAAGRTSCFRRDAVPCLESRRGRDGVVFRGKRLCRV